MAKNYAMRLRCPHGDTDTWVVVEKREETLEQVLRRTWDFECQIHGVQHELPIEAKEVGDAAAKWREGLEAPPGPPASKAAIAGEKKRKPRSSERLPVHVPVTVYGWAKSKGTFHEETETLLVNNSGALIPLKTTLEVGEQVFLVNKTARQEQEIRVVYVEPDVQGKNLLGVAFKGATPDFWKKTRRGQRIPKTIRVFVKGKDRNGNPFLQSCFTIDISRSGARLDGVGYLTAPGEVVEVKRRWRGKARYRVVWIGEIGREHSNQIGICTLEDGKDIWGIELPQQPETGKKPGGSEGKKKIRFI